LRPDGEDILVKRVRLGSAAIEAVKYDEKKRTLDVEFREGDACRYMHVPEFVYRELLKAESGRVLECDQGSIRLREVELDFREVRERDVQGREARAPQKRKAPPLDSSGGVLATSH
jgi:hexokinase